MTAKTTSTASPASPDIEARLDKLTQALFHLAGELWVVRDRQAMLERVLADAGIDALALIDDYRPDAALTNTLTAERDAFVANLVNLIAPEA